MSSRFNLLSVVRVSAAAAAVASLVLVASRPAGSPRTLLPPLKTVAAAGARPHLLLIHGYTDNCTTAFLSQGSENFTTSDGKQQTATQAPPDTTTVNFLTQSGFGWTTGDITTVGYYTWSSDTVAGGCGVNLNQLAQEHSPAAADAANCNGLSSASSYGTVNDHLAHLGCLFAWYIYDTYTRNGIPVEIVAHSMGGLITREAIGGSAGHLAGFPTQPLLVPEAVTVATPHGGVDFLLSGGSTIGFQHTDEIGDMTPGSGFMNTLGTTTFEKPQGSGGTRWGLIGASVPNGPPTITSFSQVPPDCATGADVGADWTLARAISCLATHWDNVRYPWGDGVVQAVSAMAMKADEKILYGTVVDFSAGVVYPSDPQGKTQYEHETETCQSIPLGPPDTCTNGTFYLNDGSQADDAIAFECTSSCNATDLSDMNLAHPVHNMPHSLAAIESMLVPPVAPQFVAGHAAHAGDDYPWETLGQFDHESTSQMDPWHEFYGQCDSFAAWKVYENLAGKAGTLQKPSQVPAPGFMPNDWQISPVDQYKFAPSGDTYGNADIWATRFSQLGYKVDNVPTPGAIAWWPNAVTDPQDGNTPNPTDGIGPFGHVGYVTDVYPDGSINLESYNMRGNGEYEVVHMKFDEGYTDDGFGGANMNVPWPGGFIHVADGPSGAASPNEPSDPGVLFDTYPGTPGQPYPANYNDNGTPQPGLTVIGPDDGNGDFTLAGAAYPGTVHGWYSDAGHGEIGQMLWTNTHKGAADSTATWSPRTLAANACYEVDAFVPDNWSNNDAALYTVHDQHFGTSLVPVNENNTTNDWVELGVFQANGSGNLTITLTDQGAGNGQIAADALRYMQQASCSRAIQASLTVPMTAASTSGGWTYDAGLGQLGTSDYYIKTSTSGSSSAQWAAIVVPNACYEIFAYVPDNYSDSYQAQYSVVSGSGAIPTATVDENAYTNQFASLGTYRADQNGYLLVTLDNADTSSSRYVAADTMSFVETPCPAKVLGAAYPALTLGPASPLPGFSLGNDWYNDYGHGYLGYGKWTHTNGTTPVSTATWTFTSLPANTCYKASAYIPDDNANNTSAHYQGFQGAGTSVLMFSSLINQATTAGWIYLGVVSTGSSGAATITLDDTGPVGTYTAADAVQLAAISGNCG